MKSRAVIGHHKASKRQDARVKDHRHRAIVEQQMRGRNVRIIGNRRERLVQRAARNNASRDAADIAFDGARILLNLFRRGQTDFLRQNGVLQPGFFDFEIAANQRQKGFSFVANIQHRLADERRRAVQKAAQRFNRIAIGVSTSCSVANKAEPSVSAGGRMDSARSALAA